MITNEPKKIYLCKPNLEIITVLNGVNIETVEYSRNAKDYNTLSFDVDRYMTIDGEQVESNGYKLLDTYMYVMINDIDAFQMQTPELINDGNKEIKKIIAYSTEKELEGTDFVNLKINTGEKDSQEMLVDGNINDLGFPKEYITFYNPDNPELSFLDIVLSKNKNWSVDKDDIDRDLWFKKLSITSENVNLYALLTSMVAPRIECLFLFDTINRKIKAISKETINDDYTYDTNVYIGLRNLEKSVTVSVNENSVYTRFNCSGENSGNNPFTIADWNYNDTRIFNIDYFLREPYFTLEQISNIKDWIKYRDDNRDAYADIARQQSVLSEQIYEIKYRLPNDGCEIKQWVEMDKETLYKSGNYYIALLETLMASVDTRSDSQKYTTIKIDGKDVKVYKPIFRRILKGNSLPSLTYNDNYIGTIYIREVTERKTEVYKYIKNSEGYKFQLYFTKYIGDEKPTLNNYPLTSVSEENLVGNYYYCKDNKKYYQFTRISTNEYEWKEVPYVFEPVDGLTDYNNRTVYEGEDKPTITASIGDFYKDKKNCIYYIYNSSKKWTDVQFHQYADMINHDHYLPLLKEQTNGYGGYGTYSEILKYIIPNIDVAIYNMYNIDDKVITYIEDFETNWELYGTIELENKKKKYEEELEALKEYEKPWSQLTDAEKAEYLGNEEKYNIFHNNIAKLNYWIGDENKSGTLLYQLGVLNKQLDSLNADMDSLNESRFNYINNAQIKYTDDDGNIHYNFGFDKETEQIIQTMFVDTDYTNSNIISTSVDTSVTIIDREKELYDDSVSKLYEVSQPQYMFTADIENIFRLDEFKFWSKDIDILNFIRLEIREDWIVKQRIIQITFNPCDINQNFVLTFSNMITSDTGRNDLTALINSENNGSAKNAISYGTGNSNNEVEYLTSLLNLMTRNNIFTNAVTNIVQGTTGTFDELQLTNLFGDYIKSSKIEADGLSVKGQAQISSIVSDSIDSNYIVTNLLKADEEHVGLLFTNLITSEENSKYIIDMVNGKISANEIDVNKIYHTDENGIKTYGFDLIEGIVKTSQVNVDKIIGNDGETFADLVNKVVNIDTISVDRIVGKNGETFADLVNGIVRTSSIYVDNIIDKDGKVFADLVKDVLSISTINADKIIGGNGETFADLVNSSISINDITTNLITGKDSDNNYYIDMISGAINVNEIATNLIKGQNSDGQYYIDLLTNELKMDTIIGNMAKLDSATMSNLFVEGSGFMQNLTVANKAVIDDTYIFNAVANKITVGDLKAGDITVSDKLHIVSENGGLEINEQAIQIWGKSENEDGTLEPYVGIQLGYAIDGEPSLIVRNKDGATIVTANGITEHAIADELIVNNMIKNGTLSKEKLGFKVDTEIDEDGNEYAVTNLNNIYTGDGGKFGVEYSTFKELVNNTFDDLDEKIDDSIAYRVEIESSNGNIFKNGAISTTLSCHVYKGNDEITDTIDASKFHWIKKLNDGTLDEVWNAIHFGGTKSITITPSDIYVKGVFLCSVDGITNEI